MKSIHVTYNKEDDRWDVKKSNNDAVLSHHETKEKAEAAGIRVAKEKECELFIHGMDGKIQSRNSYGNDPFPPRG